MSTQQVSSSTLSRTTTGPKHKVFGGISTGTIAQLAERFSVERIKKEDLEGQLKEINERLTSIEDNLVDLMESSDLTALKTAAGHHLSLRGSCYPTVADKPAFMNWIEDNGFHDALTMHHSTLKAMCKELLEEARPLPDGVEAYMKSRITFRRGGR